MARFDIDRFDPAPDQDLVCCICTNVLTNPIETPCRHVFCKNCLNTWMDRRKNCPTCRNRITRAGIKSVLPLVQNLINKLTVRCENENYGCIERSSLEFYDTHLKGCQHAKLACRYSTCTEKVLRKDLKDHEANCQYEEVICQKKCGLFVMVTDIPVHNCIAALKSRVEELTVSTTELTDIRVQLEETNAKLNQEILVLKNRRYSQLSPLRTLISQGSENNDSELNNPFGLYALLSRATNDQESDSSSDTFLDTPSSASSGSSVATSRSRSPLSALTSLSSSSSSSSSSPSSSSSSDDDDDNNNIDLIAREYKADDLIALPERNLNIIEVDDARPEGDIHQDELRESSNFSSLESSMTNMYSTDTSATERHSRRRNVFCRAVTDNDSINSNHHDPDNCNDIVINSLQTDHNNDESLDRTVTNTSEVDPCSIDSENMGGVIAVNNASADRDVTDLVSSDESSGFGSSFNEDQNSSSSSRSTLNVSTNHEISTASIVQKENNSQSHSVTSSDNSESCEVNDERKTSIVENDTSQEFDVSANEVSTMQSNCIETSGCTTSTTEMLPVKRYTCNMNSNSSTSIINRKKGRINSSYSDDCSSIKDDNYNNSNILKAHHSDNEDGKNSSIICGKNSSIICGSNQRLSFENYIRALERRPIHSNSSDTHPINNTNDQGNRHTIVISGQRKICELSRMDKFERKRSNVNRGNVTSEENENSLFSPCKKGKKYGDTVHSEESYRGNNNEVAILSSNSDKNDGDKSKKKKLGKRKENGHILSENESPKRRKFHTRRVPPATLSKAPSTSSKNESSNIDHYNRKCGGRNEDFRWNTRNDDPKRKKHSKRNERFPSASLSKAPSDSSKGESPKINLHKKHGLRDRKTDDVQNHEKKTYFNTPLNTTSTIPLTAPIEIANSTNDTATRNVQFSINVNVNLAESNQSNIEESFLTSTPVRNTRDHTPQLLNERTITGPTNILTGSGNDKSGRIRSERYKLLSTSAAVSTESNAAFSHTSGLLSDDESDELWNPSDHSPPDVIVSEDSSSTEDSQYVVRVPKTAAQLLDEWDSNDSDDSWKP